MHKQNTIRICANKFECIKTQNYKGICMKTLLALALVIVSAQAFSLSNNSSWQEITDARNISIKAPTVGFNAGAAKTYVSVLELCVRGSKVETLVEMPIFEHAIIDNRNTLKVIDNAVLTQDISYEQVVYRKINNFGPTVPVTITGTIALDYNIDVYTRYMGTSHDGDKLFTKAFRIPHCQ